MHISLDSFILTVAIKTLFSDRTFSDDLRSKFDPLCRDLPDTIASEKTGLTACADS